MDNFKDQGAVAYIRNPGNGWTIELYYETTLIQSVQTNIGSGSYFC